jgi:hypothetical protein
MSENGRNTRGHFQVFEIFTGETPFAHLPPQQSSVDEMLENLLDKKRVSAATLVNPRSEIAGKRGFACDADNHFTDSLRGQRLEGHVLRPELPRRHLHQPPQRSLFGLSGPQARTQEEGVRENVRGQIIQDCDRRFICPVKIMQQQQRRTIRQESHHLPRQLVPEGAGSRPGRQLKSR